MTEQVSHIPKNIFKNCFTLQYNKDSIQKKYEHMFADNQTAIIIFYVFFTALYIIAMCLFFQNGNINEFGIITGVLEVVTIVLFFIQKYKPNIKLTEAFLYFNQMIIQLISNLFIKSLKRQLGDEIYDKYSYAFISAEFLLKFSYLIFVDNHFPRIFVSYLLLSVCRISFIFTSTKLGLFELLSHYASYAAICVVSYFWCKVSKSMFYYKEKSQKQKDFLYDILNNLKNGVILYNVEKHKTKYFNNYLKKYKEFQKAIPEKHDILYTIDKEDLLDRNYKYVFNQVNIFRYITRVNQELHPELIEAFSQNSYVEIIEILKKLYRNNNEDNIFFKENLFLGFLELTSEDDSISLFEFYIKGVESFNGTYFQFMINDVTKTKVLQEKLLKEKTLLLGKISHEFKNPCIVITESIEELKETEKILQDSELYEKLQFLSNLSQYMIMLIKDFEVLASIENQLKVDVFPIEFCAKSYLNEISGVINTLIKKKNAKELTFKLNIDNSIDKITTDGLRLKQILINLLSNSVKFSEKGTIELKLEKYQKSKSKTSEILPHTSNNSSNVNRNVSSKDNAYDSEKNDYDDMQEYIKFSIIDSGKGISSNFIQNFNNNEIIKKENTLENHVGSGFGLGIVQNLCKIIGTTIQVENNTPNGCIFFFAICQDKQKDMIAIQNSMFNLNSNNCNNEVIDNFESDHYSKSSRSNSLSKINLDNSKSDSVINIHEKIRFKDKQRSTLSKSKNNKNTIKDILNNKDKVIFNKDKDSIENKCKIYIKIN